MSVEKALRAGQSAEVNAASALPWSAVPADKYGLATYREVAARVLFWESRSSTVSSVEI